MNSSIHWLYEAHTQGGGESSSAGDERDPEPRQNRHIQRLRVSLRHRANSIRRLRHRGTKITPESHAIDDLGIDSLDFLDIAFAIDKAFGIKLPLEQWTQEVNDGKATTEQYFVLKNLCARIDELMASKGAAPA